MLLADLKKTIREVPDFPKPGIRFYDLSTLFRDATAFRSSIDRMVGRFRGQRIDALAGIEARGFVLASAMAYELNVGLVMIRKAGKLPAETEGENFELEYGTARLEIHRDAVEPGQRVAIVDDLLATGGTAAASGSISAGSTPDRSTASGLGSAAATCMARSLARLSSSTPEPSVASVTTQARLPPA